MQVGKIEIKMEEKLKFYFIPEVRIFSLEHQYIINILLTAGW